MLDGETVVLAPDGPPLRAAPGHGIPVTYVIFDVLSVDGNDTTGLPYEDRRRLLDQAVEPRAARKSTRA